LINFEKFCVQQYVFQKKSIDKTNFRSILSVWNVCLDFKEMIPGVPQIKTEL